MSTHTMRPTLQTVPESLPADHVTQPTQTTVITSTATAGPVISTPTEKAHQAIPLSQSGQTPVSLKPRSSSSRVSIQV